MTRRTVFLGLVLGLLAAYPSLALLGVEPLGAAARWLLAQPLAWSFVAGVIARPYLARRILRRAP